ncbi:MAG: sigma 54-interacting transcriptional regulator, partial [Candidatus Sumerlaeaceae bacterium]|nr:sigma 54-interacting transcriptional regulator [Candidatus Sumerlaeaceae bacterium]
AEITRRGHAFTLTDCGSTNGVMVNGKLTSEHVLLRNDEIRIGNTVFLFNSELRIGNPLFSSSPVYIYPADSETVVAARRQSHLEQLTGPDRLSIESLLKFADLFAAPPAPLSETAERLMTQVLMMLMGDSAVLLMRERTSGQLRPVFAVPTDRPMRVNLSLISTVAQEQTPLMLSENPRELPGVDDAPIVPEVTPPEESIADEPTHDTRLARKLAAEAASPPFSSGLSSICAPLVADGETIGVIVVEKNETDFFSLRDLGLLQAVAKLATGALQAAQLVDRMAGLPAEASSRFVGSRSPAVTEVFRAAERAAETTVTMLITGESGTGKEVLARHIHELSPRRSGPFVALNCSAIPATLFESELFGYERGAFTGAQRTTPGKIESAHGGSLFLDEIGDLDLSLQPKLLRFLQERVFYRVGGTRAISADVRIIAATNTDLEVAVREGRFRQDLLYRLNVMQLHMPPLRERREDIPALIDYFVMRCASRLGVKVLGASDAAVALLQKYDWPGNIRELENAVERAVLLARGRVLTPADFSWIQASQSQSAGEQAAGRRGGGIMPLMSIADAERRLIEMALRETNWNQMRAAEILGIHRNTLRNKIAEYGLESARP